MCGKHKKKRKDKYDFPFWLNIFNDREIVSHKELRADLVSSGIELLHTNRIISDAVKQGYLDKSDFEDVYNLNTTMSEFVNNLGENLAPHLYKP